MWSFEWGYFRAVGPPVPPRSRLRPRPRALLRCFPWNGAWGPQEGYRSLFERWTRLVVVRSTPCGVGSVLEHVFGLADRTLHNHTSTNSPEVQIPYTLMSIPTPTRMGRGLRPLHPHSYYP